MRFSLVVSAAFSAILLSACDSRQPANEVLKDSAQVASASTSARYHCESGKYVMADYPHTDSAVVEYKSQQHRMHIEVSASGARYVSGSLEWWTKGSGPGSEGTLFVHNADGTTGDRIELCKAE